MVTMALERAINDGAIDSMQSFMEDIIRAAKQMEPDSVRVGWKPSAKLGGKVAAASLAKAFMAAIPFVGSSAKPVVEEVKRFNYLGIELWLVCKSTPTVITRSSQPACHGRRA